MGLRSIAFRQRGRLISWKLVVPSLSLSALVLLMPHLSRTRSSVVPTVIVMDLHIQVWADVTSGNYVCGTRLGSVLDQVVQNPADLKRNSL